ncbi:MAG: histidinol dehydrogenase, partial [Acidobacteria bacterium]|nr:histidinol dehydrogenase [Acidobacteriota bacterium]
VFAERVDRAIRARVRRLAKDAVAREALRRRGATIVVADLAQAVGIVNRLAPELVSVQVEDPRRLLDSIENAGVVFLGPWSAVALGDFVAGANHVVPTGGSARYSSPLRVADFVHRTSVVEVPAHQYGRLALAAETFAIHQDLPEDAASLRAGRRGAV